MKAKYLAILLFAALTPALMHGASRAESYYNDAKGAIFWNDYESAYSCLLKCRQADDGYRRAEVEDKLPRLKKLALGAAYSRGLDAFIAGDYAGALAHFKRVREMDSDYEADSIRKYSDRAGYYIWLRQCESVLPFSPVQISIFTPVQIIPQDMSVIGVDVGLIYSCNRDVYGVQAGIVNETTRDGGLLQVGFYNHTGRNFFGLQTGVFGNQVDRDFYGMQYTLLFNTVNGNCTGLQFSVWDNVTLLDFTGIQFNVGLKGVLLVAAVIAPFYGLNLSGVQMPELDQMGNMVEGSLYGLQICCFLNTVKKDMYGIQVGLFNLAGKLGGFQAGAMNWCDGGGGVQLGIANIGEFYGLDIGAVCSAYGDAGGLLISPVNISSGHVVGLQAGVVNYASELTGLQVGLINICGSGGLPFMIGLNPGFAKVNFPQNNRNDDQRGSADSPSGGTGDFALGAGVSLVLGGRSAMPYLDVNLQFPGNGLFQFVMGLGTRSITPMFSLIVYPEAKLNLSFLDIFTAGIGAGIYSEMALPSIYFFGLKLDFDAGILLGNSFRIKLGFGYFMNIINIPSFMPAVASFFYLGLKIELVL